MKKIRGIFFVLLLVFLSGCKKEAASETVEETARTKFAFFEIEDSYIVPVSENCSQWHFFEDKVYSLEFEETGYDTAYYLKSYDRNGATEEFRSDAFSHLSWKKWCMHKGKTGNLLSILSRDDSGYFLVRVNLDTLEAETINVEDDIFKTKTIKNIEVSPDNKYLFEGNEYIYILSDKGKMEEFTYKVEGYTLFASDKKPGLQKGQKIYSYDPKTYDIAPVCSLSDSKIRKEDVRNIALWNDKYYVLTEEETGIKVNILAENKNAVKEEKIELVLFQPFVRAITQEEIDEFNFENDKYEVVMDKISYTDMQFRFLHEDKPDIICLVGYEALAIPDYARAGYIRDLYPYIDESDKIHRDDLVESMVRGLETDGKLYGLSEKLTFQTPFIYNEVDTSDYNARTAIDIYVQAAKERNYGGLWSVESLQDLIFTGLTDDILKDENGNCEFNAPLIKEMLERIKNSGADIKRKDLAEMNIPMRDFYFGSRNRIESVADIAVYTDGYNLKIIGYPSLCGDPVYLQGYSDIMTISKECKYPEGAFEFIEFMMTRSELYGNQEGSLYSLKSLNKKGRYPGTLKNCTELQPITIVVDGEVRKVEFTEEKFEFLQYMSNHVVYDTADFWSVTDIIFEEAPLYFNGDKTIEETMNVIESRVSLYLEEKE